MQAVTIVTGASSGIGKSVAKLLSNQNYKILAISRNSSQIQNNPNIIPFQADLSKEEDIKSIVDFIGINYKVKNVIHSAGIIGSDKGIQKYSYEEINYMIRVNLIAPIFLNHQLIDNKKFLDRVRILNISSEAAHEPLLNYQSYCVTKAGLDMSWRAQKFELAKKGLYWGALKPGFVDTPMFRHAFPNFPEESLKDVISTENVATFVEYLLSSKITDDQFIQQVWDIYHRSHQKFWLRDGQYIPLMAPKY